MIMTVITTIGLDVMATEVLIELLMATMTNMIRSSKYSVIAIR